MIRLGVERLGLALALALVLCACGSESSKPELSPPDLDGGMAVHFGQDAFDQPKADSILASDSGADLDAVDHVDVPGAQDVQDAGGPVEVEPCEVPGGWGCACTKDGDCLSDYCIQTPSGAVCTKSCVDSCPSNWACVQVQGTTDITYLCVPPFLTLCRPCDTDKDCAHVGAEKGANRCIPSEPTPGFVNGSFCGSSCAVSSDCPSAYACQEVTLGDEKVKQCVPQGQECGCTQALIDKGVSTSCFVQNDAGLCGGFRMCTVEGLSLCSAATPVTELCDGKDNDCDGLTDEGFVYDDGGVDKPLGKPCGTGACLGGEVMCSADGSEAICSAGGKSTKETCDFQDNDCDGLTDEGLGLAESDCLKLGVCANGQVEAKCKVGAWKCDYGQVYGYEPGGEKSCDKLDNDCDGLTDEDFVYQPLGAPAPLPIGAACDGVGACGKGVVQCAKGGIALAVCSTDPKGDKSEVQAEKCNGLDDDCDGKTDEGCDDDQDGFCDEVMGFAGQPAICPKGAGDCDDAQAAVHPGVVEICDDVDNDCDGATDEQCDGDGDGYCDEGKKTVGKPKVCPKGGGDCDDGAKNVHPGAEEICDAKGVDEDCDGQKQEPGAVGCASYYPDGDKDGWGAKGQAAKCLCKPEAPGGYTAKKTGDCNDNIAKINPGQMEDCKTGFDDNCNGKTNEEKSLNCIQIYRDVDGDGWGDKKIAPKCMCQIDFPSKYTAFKGGDCDDGAQIVNPGVQELCSTPADDNCNGPANEAGALGCQSYYKDGDKDGYGAKGSKPVCLCKAQAPGGFTSSNAKDCDDGDAAVKPGIVDKCATPGVDDNCDGQVDPEGSAGCKKWYYDGDKDGFGLSISKCLCKADPASKFTSSVPGDCDDNNLSIRPGAPELCNGVDDNCKNGKDEGASASCKLISHGAPKCAYGKCAIALCSAGWFDVDKSYSTGCECKADAWWGKAGASCSKFINAGTFSDAGTYKTFSGNIMPGEAGDWYRFYALDTADTGTGACDKFHVKVQLVSNPGDRFRFDMYRGSCAGGNQLCKDQTSSSWRTDFYGSKFGPGTKADAKLGVYKPSPIPNPGGECKCSTVQLKGGQSVPGMNLCTSNSAYFYVFVHRKVGTAPTCSSYVLRIANNK